MPLRLAPKSLTESSLTAIARHFDQICYNCKSRSEMRQMMEDETFMNVEGPFKTLPPALCVRLQDALHTVYGHLRRYHLHAIVHPNQEKFLINSVADKHFSLELIESKCKRLRNLDLSYLCHVSPMCFLSLIPSLKSIVDLNLKMTEIPDEALRLIGKLCLEIRVLNISSCPVTSSGIMDMCFDPKTEKSLCQKLLCLNITGCNIQAEALDFLLHNIPTIRELDYENTLETFNVKRCRSNSPSPMDTVFNLSHLTSTDNIVSEWNLERATNFCPFATHVTVSNSIIQNESLYKLMTLQYLQHLKLTNNDNLSLDFYEGIMPVLTVCGNRLESLLLNKFTYIDINVIGEACPKLKNFALCNIAHYEDVRYPNDKYFNNLTVLELWTNVFDESLDETFLKQLLYFCHDIQNILISGSRAFSDKLLSDTWKRNPMKDLSRVTIENCPNISVFPFDHLLTADNTIATIRIWSCFLLTKIDHEYLQQRIQIENFDVYLEWYPWFQ